MHQEAGEAGGLQIKSERYRITAAGWQALDVTSRACRLLRMRDNRPGAQERTPDARNMRQNGVRGLDVTCQHCGNHTEVNVDA
jgi:hypothetical protein